MSQSDFDNPPGKRNTRNRILVASLLLFNEQGEPNTTTNQIANEIDISPGNLHYHFNTKADLVEALLQEFHADTREILIPPDEGPITIEDFWLFLQLLVERMATYRFLFRDIDTIITKFRSLQTGLQSFISTLSQTFASYVDQLQQYGILRTTNSDRDELCKSLVVITLFSERYDILSGRSNTAEDASMRAVRSALHLLLPYLEKEDAKLTMSLADRYR